MVDTVHRQEEGRGTHLADYWPLVCLIALVLLAALALGFARQDNSIRLFMHHFMGLLLVVYSMFKIFDLNGYADGFQMYDLLAKRVRAYGYIYPFIELGLGLAYLAIIYPIITYSLTILVFTFGTLGVFDGLRRGLDIDCPCMGNTLKVPLSTVSLVENLGMGFMALAMLFVDIV